MKVLLVGPSAARTRMRAALNGSMQIVGEFPTLDAARAAHVDAGGILLADPADAGRRREPSLDEEDDDVAPEPLTSREVDVLELLAEGLPNKAIAERLGISDQTVKFHVASIAAKLGAANRTDAVRRAARRGLITL
ncbi:MAG: response regulator transcription factor [Acidobacteria bacterium]|nr:response regulator transcription factor [Acidobacteriota bacterium]